MRNLFWKYVGSYTKKNIIPNDIDVRTFYLTKYAKRDFHDKILDKSTGKVYDFDYWELSMAIKDIIDGGSNIFLYNTLFCDDYKTIDYFGKKLVDNFHKFHGQNLIESAINYIDKKIEMVYSNLLYSRFVTPHKTIYYACTDVTELMWNLDGNYGNKMELSNDILDIKNEKMPLVDAIVFANELRKKVSDIKIFDKPDKKWANEYIEEVYYEYENYSKI